MGFIYKITNKISGKCYIGETIRPDPETRWKQHIQKINKNEGCPALRDAVKKYGIDNFKFEIIIICFDEDRFRYEKEYIEKYKSQVPNGYNILPGGLHGGGGFLGKKHSEESIKKMVEGGKRFRENNPNHFETYREKLKESMKKVDISSAVKNSEKWKKAKEEGRIGGAARKEGKHSDETKQKIKESLIKYYKNNTDKQLINIEKHRDVMAKSKGRQVAQFSQDGTFIKEYISISEAARQTNTKKSTVQSAVSGRSKMAGGFIWKYVDEKNLKTQEEV
jgi:group I intron endonuclease